MPTKAGWEITRKNVRDLPGRDNNAQVYPNILYLVKKKKKESVTSLLNLTFSLTCNHD